MKTDNFSYEKIDDKLNKSPLNWFFLKIQGVHKNMSIYSKKEQLGFNENLF